jgi:hypothetical protein
MRIVLSSLLLACSLCAQNEPGRIDNAVWYGSIGAMAGGSAADALSSWQGCELNPVLKNSDGRFETKAAVVKAAVLAGVVTSEWLLRRRHGAIRAFTIVNFASGGLFGVTAWHNGDIHMTGGVCR